MGEKVCSSQTRQNAYHCPPDGAAGGGMLTTGLLMVLLGAALLGSCSCSFFGGGTGITFVDIFHDGWPRGKPEAVRHSLGEPLVWCQRLHSPPEPPPILPARKSGLCLLLGQHRPMMPGFLRALLLPRLSYSLCLPLAHLCRVQDNRSGSLYI